MSCWSPSRAYRRGAPPELTSRTPAPAQASDELIERAASPSDSGRRATSDCGGVDKRYVVATRIAAPIACCDSEGARVLSDAKLARADIAPMHRTRRVRPGRFCWSSGAGARLLVLAWRLSRPSRAGSKSEGCLIPGRG